MKRQTPAGTRDQTTTTKRPETKAQSPAGSLCEHVSWVAGSQQRPASHSESRGSGILWHICLLSLIKPLSQMAFYWLTQVFGTNVLQRKCKDGRVWDIRPVKEPLHIHFPGNWPQGGNQDWDINTVFLSSSAFLSTYSAVPGSSRWTHARIILVKMRTLPKEKPRDKEFHPKTGKPRISRGRRCLTMSPPSFFNLLVTHIFHD